jgi:hypothetical protein
MEITANAVQTVTASQNLVFTNTPVAGNCSILHREDSGIIKLRGLTVSQPRARFKASFGGNVAIPSTGTAGAISLAISLDGEPIATTSMIVTPAAVSEYFNVGADIFIDVPAGCCATLGVTNTSTQAILVQNANMIVERVA